MKQKKNKNELMEKTKGYVGAGVSLGIGSAVLEGMGQGAIAGKVITPAANMMGPMISADMGMSVLKMFGKKRRKI